MFLDLGYWYPVKDGDQRAYLLMQRHYTFHQYQDGRRFDLSNPNRHLFVGPGMKLVLLGSDENALFVWRKFIDKSGQTGINCAVFHNESQYKASSLILEAEQLAWHKWPNIRLYTYVDAKKIKSTLPGFCFLAARWHYCGTSKAKGLIIMEKYPSAKSSNPRNPRSDFRPLHKENVAG